MSIDTIRPPDHLYIRRQSGRTDPVITAALSNLEMTKLEEWAMEWAKKTGKECDSPEECRTLLFNSLKKNAGTLRAVTRRMRQELSSDVERLLYSNPTLYALSLRHALDVWEKATTGETVISHGESPEYRELANSINNLVQILQPMAKKWSENKSIGPDSVEQDR